MTTSVVVKARAWGATVVTRTATEGGEGHNVEEQTHELTSHEDRTFHVQPGQKTTFEVFVPAEAPQPEEAVEEVMTAQDADPPKTEDAPTPAPKASRRNFGSSSDEAAEA
jgi:hypothetical protein